VQKDQNFSFVLRSSLLAHLSACSRNTTARIRRVKRQERFLAANDEMQHNDNGEHDNCQDQDEEEILAYIAIVLSQHHISG